MYPVFVLPCSASDQHADGNIQYVVVPADADALQLMLRRMHQVSMHAALDASLSELVFSDYSAAYVSSSGAEELVAGSTDQPINEVQVLATWLDLSNVSDPAAELADLPEMVVSTAAVYWQAYIHKTDIRLTSNHVTKAQLEAALAQQAHGVVTHVAIVKDNQVTHTYLAPSQDAALQLLRRWYAVKRTELLLNMPEAERGIRLMEWLRPQDATLCYLDAWWHRLTRSQGSVQIVPISPDPLAEALIGVDLRSDEQAQARRRALVEAMRSAEHVGVRP